MATVTVIAAYDIAADSRRARVAALMQAHGDRVQRSVFVVRADPATLTELHARAEAIIDPVEDSLYFFGQCGNCWHDMLCIGQAHPPESVLFWAVL